MQRATSKFFPTAEHSPSLKPTIKRAPTLQPGDCAAALPTSSTSCSTSYKPQPKQTPLSLPTTERPSATPLLYISSLDPTHPVFGTRSVAPLRRDHGRLAPQHHAHVPHADARLSCALVLPLHPSDVSGTDGRRALELGNWKVETRPAVHLHAHAPMRP